MTLGTRLEQICTVVIAMSLGGFAFGDDIDDFVEAERIRQRIPGLSLAIVRDGQINKSKGYGLANVELNVAASPDTIYQSGSIGKQFTAAAILLLAEEQKLDLDDSISDYLSDTPEAWNAVTIRHLLTHTSGVGDVYQTLDLQHDASPDELLAKAAEVEVEFEPGEKWEYSNTGYMLLGFVIETITGSSYHEFLSERIYRPAAMKSARGISEADLVPNRAAGYRLVEGEIKNHEWVAPSLNTTADGSTYLSAIDLANWSIALESEVILRQSSKDTMWSPIELNDGSTYPYGFAWYLGGTEGHKELSHGGAWQGFTTYFTRFVDDRVAVIVLTNLADADPDKIAEGVARLVIPHLPESPVDLD
jgi:CubicO group peptidase (beta-lactamase class C family)